MKPLGQVAACVVNRARRLIVDKRSPDARFFFEFPSEGVERLKVEEAFFTSERYLATYDRADWGGVRPDLMTFAAGFVLAARAQGIPLFVHEAYRHPDRQDKLFASGLSKLPGPLAPHCTGAAVDVVHAVHGWNLRRVEWEYVGRLGLEVARRLNLKVVWGGQWEFFDAAHWQLPNWAEFTPVRDQGVVRLTPRQIIGKRFI